MNILDFDGRGKGYDAMVGWSGRKVFPIEPPAKFI